MSTTEKTLPVVAPESPLAGLFGDATFADIDIVAFEGEDSDESDDDDECGKLKSSAAFAAHRAVLAAASPYFRSMFSSGFAESRTRTVELRGVPPKLLELLLKFCYGGKLAAVPRASLLPLAALADRLDVPALRSAVDAAIDADLGPQTAAEYAAAAAAMRDAGGGGLCIGIGGGEIGGGGSDGGANNNGGGGGGGGNDAREALLDRCLDALCSEFSAAAAEPAFLRLDERTLASVLEREDLVAASEAEVFDAVCRWALAGNEEEDEDDDDEGNGQGESVVGVVGSRLARTLGSSSSSSSSSAFERLCRRVRFGSMAPADLAAAAANPLALASPLVQGMVLRAFVHIHAPRKPPSAAGGATGGESVAHSNGAAVAAAAAAAAAASAARASARGAAAAVALAPSEEEEQDGMDEDPFSRAAEAAALASAAAAPALSASAALLSPATPPLDQLEPLAAAAADQQQQQHQQQRMQQHQHQHRPQKAPSSQNLLLTSFRGDSVSLPPRGGAGARLRLRVIVADGACSWPLDPSAPACPPGRHCGCPPATAGARPRGLALTMPRDATVGALKRRACRDLGLDPRAFALFDFYNGQKYGRGALCEQNEEAAENGGEGGEGFTCGAADLRDGQLVLLELRR